MLGISDVDDVMTKWMKSIRVFTIGDLKIEQRRKGK